MVLESRNPASGELVAAYPETSPDAVTRVLRAGKAAFPDWRSEPFAARGALLVGVADALTARSESLARLMAVEMGKPLAQGRAEVEKCAWVCRHYAEHGEKLLATETIETDAARSFVAFAPLGLVLAVMPWNFPLWQVLRFAAPALMAGNCGLLKHASNVSGCALALAECFRAAGAPAGLFQTVLVGPARVDTLIAAPEVVAVTLTGSTPAGRAVAKAAGQHLKKTVLELGGSDPYLVLEDADLEQAAEACVTSRLINSGQSCIAAKRFLVVSPVRARFEELFVEKMRAKRMGDAFDPASDLGPLARVDLRDGLHDQVERSLRAGARRLLGGVVPPGKGAFYPPTVLTDVRPGMAVQDEETFGPVAALVPVRDEAEAVRLANASPFGLGAAVFTQDVQRGERLAGALEAGSVFVNAYVRSDPRLPFGGIKESGYGRELSSYGMREFVNVKTVYRK
jgi:succinate-semialdehyde dehydrogenase / glutarate-semialdehyde dehydrogenase